MDYLQHSILFSPWPEIRGSNLSSTKKFKCNGLESGGDFLWRVWYIKPIRRGQKSYNSFDIEQPSFNTPPLGSKCFPAFPSSYKIHLRGWCQGLLSLPNKWDHGKGDIHFTHDNGHGNLIQDASQLYHAINNMCNMNPWIFLPSLFKSCHLICHTF